CSSVGYAPPKLTSHRRPCWAKMSRRHDQEVSSGIESAREGTGGLPVAPSLEPTLATVQSPAEYAPVDRRVIFISALALGIGAIAALIANILTHLIGFITNLAYYGRISGAFSAPSTDRLGVWSIFVPIVGAFIVGLM